MKKLTNRNIPLDRLTLSSANVRTASADPEDDKELQASILSLGVLESLLVVPNGDDTFGVVAGGRRLAALQQLAEAGKIPAGYVAPCRIYNGGADPAEMSLHENEKRAAMHPADQVRGVRAAAGQGHDGGRDRGARGRQRAAGHEDDAARVRRPGAARRVPQRRDAPPDPDGLHRHRRPQGAARRLGEGPQRRNDMARAHPPAAHGGRGEREQRTRLVRRPRGVREGRRPGAARPVQPV